MSSYEAAHYSRDDPPYLAPYGLLTAPFSSGYDERFLYLDDKRQQFLHTLQQLVEHNQLLLMVVGERGIGKTSLKQRFISSAGEGEDWLISEVNAHPMMDADELLSSIAQGFGLLDLPASPAELQNTLYRYLAGLQHHEVRPILLVDDAHELPQDALEALFYLTDAEASGGNLLRSILLCEPSINVMLNSSVMQPLKARVTHMLEIAPFGEEQTAEYLKHRLAVAGLEGTSPFSPGEIKQIYQVSGGIPDRINEAAHLILNGNKLDEFNDDENDFLEQELPARSLSIKYVVLGGMVILLIAAVFLWQDDIDRLRDETDQSPAGEVTATPAPTVTTNQKSERSTERTIELDVSGADHEPAQQATDDTLSVPSVVAEAEDRAPVSSPERQPSSMRSDMSRTEPARAEEIAPALRIIAIEPRPVPASDKPQTLTLKGEGFAEDARITVEWGNQRKTLPDSRVRYVSESQLEFDITVGTTADTWVVIARNPQTGAQASTRFGVEPGVAQQTPAAPLAVEQTKQRVELDDQAWLIRQPAAHYTLQLLASRQADNLRQFVEQHQLTDKTVSFASRDNGNLWHALIYGSYASRQAAEQASRNLPSDIKPWIRQFASIQKGLVKTGEDKNQTDSVTITSKSAPRSQSLRDHAAWLWDQDPSRYTLQLLGGRNEQAVKQFIGQHNLEGKAVFYRTRRDGKPWYVVVLGSYVDRDAALSARKQVSDSLARQQPWPRSFSDIHADLSRN